MASNIPPPIRDPGVKFTQIFINNEFIASDSGKTFPVTNPATGQKIIDVQEGDKSDVDKAVKAAGEAFEFDSEWRNTLPSARGRLLYKLADLVERDIVYLASLETLENGKPYRHSMAVALKGGVSVLRYYAGWADKICGKTIPIDEDTLCYTRHEPVGVCGQIIPWNFPIKMFVWKVAPALAAGCTVVVKPAEQTPLTALYLAALTREAGFPPGVVNVVPGYGPTAGAAIANHVNVSKVAFTGSTEVGQLIMAAAAKSNLKSVTLELGGKSPLIIMPDTDMEKAVQVAHHGVFFNMGQMCIAGSRILVHESKYDEFVAKSAAAAEKRIVGDPFHPKSDSGPQVDEQQYKKILDLIESGKREGATCQAGGSKIGDVGYYIQSTVFSDVTPNMRIAKEEIFGPVMSIMKFNTLDEAIKLANDTAYGLAAGILTNDIDTYLHVANRLQAGTVWVNSYGIQTPSAPVGGFKLSGIGREMGEYGLQQYTEIKSIIVKHPKPRL